MKKHIVNKKGITYSKYFKNYKNKTKKYWKKGMKKNEWKDPNNLTPIVEVSEDIKKRCPNGSRRNKKTEFCVKKSEMKKRCPNGSRKNRKTKICISRKK
jgi:hypothetical protein